MTRPEILQYDAYLIISDMVVDAFFTVKGGTANRRQL
jgi:hypothetical protein